MSFLRLLAFLAIFSVASASAQQIGPTTGLLQNAAAANVNGSVLGVSGQGTAVLTINCVSCSGGTTVNFEGTQDGANWSAVQASEPSSPSTTATSTTTSGVTFWSLPVAGFSNIRARISGYSAGTVTVTALAVPLGGGGGGGGGGSGSNASVGATGSAVPASGTYAAGNESGVLTGFILDASGNLLVNVAAGTITAINPSVSATGSAVPASATYNGLNSSGTLVGWPGDITNGGFVNIKTSVLPTNAATSALQTTGNSTLSTINTTLGTPMQNSGGSVTANLGTLNGAATAANQVTTPATGNGTTNANTQRVTLSSDGTGQVALASGSNLVGNVGTGVYPAGSTPITASATGTTTATTATLAANASLHTYICGFSIRANATAAATNDSTVTGTVTGTLHFTQWTAPNASGIGLTEEIFSPCVISSAVNTGIAVISGAPGTSGVVSVTTWGFQGPT